MMFDSSDAYFLAQDEFRRYIEDRVNPARAMNGLSPIGDHEARECFRILDNLYDPQTKTLSERNLPQIGDPRLHQRRSGEQ